MGNKAISWAYTLELPPSPKSVLIALADQASDATNTCFPGQQRLVTMTGLSLKTVERAIRYLEAAGLVERTRRTTEQGWRTSDLYLVRVGATPLPVTVPTRQEAQKAPRLEDSVSGLPVTVSTPTRHHDGAIKTSSLRTPSSTPQKEPSDRARASEVAASAPAPAPFDVFWSVYPRRDEKKRAIAAFEKAIKRAPIAAVIAGATRYRDDPNRDQAFTKQAPTWLNGDCWDDPPLPPRRGSPPTETRTEAILRMATTPGYTPPAPNGGTHGYDQRLHRPAIEARLT